MTVSYLVFFMNRLVEFLNTVFSEIEFFDQSKESYYTGLKFMIHRTQVFLKSLYSQASLIQTFWYIKITD